MCPSSEHEDELCLSDLFEPEPEVPLADRDWVAAPISRTIFLEPLAAVWGSSLHVARWLIAHPEYIQGRTVGELGGGTGLPSLVAAALGAKRVAGSDYDAAAVGALRRAAEYNGLAVSAVQAECG
jgi:predicted nicotinamide N-methyase|mmetsp:Transcript_42475/g.95978  ORF Transcript_42475/g.95978 Transcript_42475/m.95978 type:complete len:125 (-) Transcript_42475:92-466(-)